MFDTCPSDYTDTEGTVGKCEEEVYTADRSYDDMVIVSDPNNVIYRNIYCALCHGVTDVIRWQLSILACLDELESKRLSASEMKKFIMERCYLVSERPGNLVLNSRLLPCQHEIVGNCSDDDAVGVTNETIAGCEDGPFMPYSVDGGPIYKNALCYRCNGHQDVSTHLCLDGLAVLGKSNIGGLTKLLQTVGDVSKSTRETSCGESQIMDHYTNQCVTLYCPPFEAVAYGTCQPIATPVRISVKIRAIFWTTKTLTVIRPIRSYNATVEDYYVRKLRKRFGALECPGMSVTVRIHTEPGTNELLYLLVVYDVGIDERKCTIRNIGNAVRNQPSLTESWLINGEMVPMTGHYTFFRHVEREDSRVDTDSLIWYVVLHIGEITIDEFVVCPYVEIDLDMYNNLLTTAYDGSTDDVKNLTAFTVKTEPIRGAYIFSENQVAVCVNRYLKITNAANEAAVLKSSSSQKVLFLPCLVMGFLLSRTR